MGKRFFFFLLVACWTVFSVQAVAAKEKSFSEAEFQDAMGVLEQVEEREPSDSVFKQFDLLEGLRKSLADVRETREKDSPLSAKERKRFLILEERIQELISGPHCEKARELEEIQKMVFSESPSADK